MIIKYLLALFAAAAVGAQAQQTGTSSPCNICGEGGEITNPDAVLLLQQQLPEVEEGGIISCAQLDVAGKNGLIPNAVCALLPDVIMHVCDCQYNPSQPPQSYCQFCPNGITIKNDPVLDDDDDAIVVGGDDGMGNTLCQRLTHVAKIISAESSSCEELQESEQVCCPSDNSSDNPDGSMSYGSYSYSVAYHTKAAKRMTPKGIYHKSKADKLIRARD
jgi:hypothetical protein